MEKIKAVSSKWIKTKGNEYRAFAWQNGYGAFSLGQSQISAVKNYIKNQKQHHVRQTFQEEYLLLLKKYQFSFDERYLWD
ncbi:MAG: Transposase IS200 like protein [bacterium ADurb.Bin478]|nr:MAG: Transposase IS200 like protein [bacterium ADurb.Bin478]